MRILNWVQGRVIGKNEKNRMGVSYTVTSQCSHKEEFDDWPQSFLAIGTFGNAKPKKNPERQYFFEKPQDLANLTVQVNGFLKEINTPFSYGEPYIYETQSEQINLSLDTSLDRTSYVASESTTFRRMARDMEKEKENELHSGIKIITARTKDAKAESQRVFKRKSVLFLIKRLIAYRGSFAPAPGLRDPISESRMEILKATLQKKICPHSPAPTTSVSKYLQRSANEARPETQLQEKPDDVGIWNKTDSEYIVLEI